MRRGIIQAEPQALGSDEFSLLFSVMAMSVSRNSRDKPGFNQENQKLIWEPDALLWGGVDARLEWSKNSSRNSFVPRSGAYSRVIE